MSAQLDNQAISILKENDLGGYTIPTKGLYPYQWNWDSAFVALGFATFNMERAWEEIELLFEGQWDDGMVPHIIFRKDDPSYFPGPSVWGTTNPKIPTSGHSQPPVAATVVRRLFEQDTSEAGKEKIKTLFPKLLAWHRWYHTYRDPEGHGVIAIMHPWESGRDNLPDWDNAASHVDISDIGEYTRKDTSHVNPEMRPKKIDYDRYLAIVKFGRDNNWDPKIVADQCPFFVADPGNTFILLRADRDLLAMAEALGETDAAEELKGWIALTEKGVAKLWNEEKQAFCTYDLRNDVLGDGISSASFLAPYAGIREEKYINPTREHFDRIAAKVNYTMPSYDPDHPLFESMRYWRGPVWGIINYLIATGFADMGDTARAERLRTDTVALIEKSDFAEYFDPITGEGAGGNSFSWTSAIWLTWATPSLTAKAA
ncbi:alpha-glucosidase [Pseudovibrio sp. W64]|uniref:MGH1-like glycoside hydrolase domain-containing protein n=1 Tax=Pseudovibrio sp. W64 TaxID=1735583 RepID=UPI0007AE6C43|nr:trehalase family glycosidase [Pseudovibrio sp. W64]KZK79352.1 alpha-glucosidase [Pseudovibrio sp. W64]